MNNSMNFFKRLTAFLLAMLLVTTMMGDDFFSFAEDPAVVTESSGGEAAAAPASEGGGDFVDVSTPVVEATPEAAPVAEEAAPAVTESVETQATPEEATPAENPTEIASETNTTDGATPALDENGNPISSEDIDNPEVTKDQTTEDAEEGNDEDLTDEEKEDEEDKDKEDEDKDKEDEDKDKAEDKDCEHAEWSYSSNGDGTHKKICAECGEEQVEACTFNEDGVCIHCGYEKPKEEEECEHEWEYVSNGNGTHKKICKKCGEEAGEESCTYDEDLVCIHCGYQDECEHEEWEYVSNEDGTHKKICKRCHIEEECTFGEDRKCTRCGYEKECEHEEWEYTSNEDGTHTKRCKECGYEEIENCEFDENWVCKHCGYEDMTLVYQSYSSTIMGTTVTVSGEMPRNSSVTVYYAGKKAMENIVNNNLDEGTFKAYAAYNINIYDRHGNKYQPMDNGKSVSVSFSNVNDLDEVADEDVAVYRIEDDYSVTEMDSNASGDYVAFDAEHFSVYVTGSYSDMNEGYTLEPDETFAAVAQATTDASGNNYTRVKYATFDIFVDDVTETYTFNVTVRKNLTSESSPESGTVAGTGSYSFTPSRTGWMTVEVPIKELVTGNGYITSGNYYSIIVEHWDNTVNLGSKYYSGIGSSLRVKGTTGAWSGASIANALYLSTEANSTTGSQASLEMTSAPEGNYTVDSITLDDTRAVYAGGKYYIAQMASSESIALTAKLSDESVERLITWSSSYESYASVTSTGNMTANLKALSPGETTITATYNGSTAEITVVVLNVTIGGAEAIGSTPVDCGMIYDGSAKQPAIALYKDNTGTAVTSGVTIAREDNINAGTAKVTITYTVASTPITLTRYFTISPVTLTEAAFANATFTIENGAVTNIANIGAISGVTPKFSTDTSASDITATIDSLDGITSAITISAIDGGNYTGSVTVNYESKDISNSLSVELSDSFKNSQVYTGSPISADSIWTEATFYNSNNEAVSGVVTSSTASCVIYDVVSGYTAADYAGSYSSFTAAQLTEMATTAGEKAAVFTMTADGYSGSIFTTFTVQQADMSKTYIKWVDGDSFARTGSNVEPSSDASKAINGTGDYKVYLNWDASTETGFEVPTSEYTESYQGSRSAIGDTPTLVVKGNGINFQTNTQTSQYSIAASYERDLIVRITSSGKYYDGTYDNSYATGYSEYYKGSTVAPSISVRLNQSRELTLNTEYTYAIYDAYTSSTNYKSWSPNVGTKYIVVTDATSTATSADDKVLAIATYEVTQLPISNSAVTATLGSNASSKEFTGAALTWSTATSASEAKVVTNIESGSPTSWATTTTTDADLTVKFGDVYLEEGVDYTINYGSDYVNVGTVVPTITGKGNYTGTLSQSKYRYKITVASLDSDSGRTKTADATATPTVCVYNGSDQTPSITVTIGTTFSETFEYTGSTYESTNFTVSYPDDKKSPGVHTITVTGKNNLVGTALVTYTITSNTDEYSSIYIGGKGVTLLTSMGTNGVETIGDVTTRYYTCTSLEAYYKAGKYTTGVVVNGSDGTQLTRNTDYSYSFNNNTNANTSTSWAVESSPYVKIKGLGNYANNNAIVFFNIKPRSLNDSAVTVSDVNENYGWTGSKVQPTPIVKFNSTTLTDTDYTVAYYDTYDETTNTGTGLTAKAGTKYIVLTGLENYSDTRIITYTVGTTLEDVKVTIRSGYYSATSETWYEAADYKDSSGNLVTFDVTYRNGKAPIIILTDSSGTALDSEAYTISTPTSSLEGLSDENLYDARPAGSDGAYNVLTYTVTPNEEKGFTGDPITLLVRINPQNIATAVSATERTERMRLGDSTKMQVVYTGSEQFAEPDIYFYYGAKTNEVPEIGTEVAGVSSKLEQGTDFTPTKEEFSIGTDVSSAITKTVYGVGNFNGSQALTYQITKGYVQTRKGATAANSILVGETSSTDIAPTYNLTDESKEYNTVYTYDGTEHEIPPMFLTATNGTTPLELGTDYTVNYYDNGVLVTDATMSAFKTNVGVKTIEFVVTGDNYVTQTIKATYEIKSNSIENYTVKMSDVTYSGVAVTPGTLKNYIENGTVTLSVAKNSETTETLTYGTDSTNGDYYIVTDTSELANITGETAIAGSNDTPTVGGAYFYIKGNLPYSGYKKISFNIVLDISDDAVATVSIQDPSYNLEADGTVSGEGIIPVIKYKKTTDSNGTYSGDITDIATISDCVTVSRARDKKPGPDGEITVKGKANSICTGTVNNVKYVSGSTSADVYFLASLATFEGIGISTGTVYSYTGSAVNPTFYIPGLEDVEPASVTVDTNGIVTIHSGAYGVVYEAADGKITKEAVAAGAWKAIIKPGSDSQYFTQGSSRTLTFNIKYDLSTATMSFEGASTDDSDGIPKVGYTGTAYSFTDNVKILSVDGEKYIYNAANGNTSLVTISPTSRTLMGTYTVSATALNTDMVYGSLSSKFKISGVGISEEDVTLAYTSTVYTGKACEPGVTVVVNGVTLTKGTDFDVTYSSNINAGTATVKVSGKGNYSGSVTKTFTITQKPLSECTIELEEAYYIGTGTGLKVEPAIKSITNGTVTLTESDYEIVGYTNSDSKATAVLNNNTEQSSWTTWPQITIKAKDGGNYSGTATQKYEIKKLDLNSSDVSISPNTTEFTGAVIDPYSVVSLTVTYNGTTTTLAKYDSSTGVGDYTITVQNSAGAVADLKAKDTYTLLIDGKNSCENTTTMSFTVTERSLPDNYHYYYTTEYAKIGTWEYKSDLYDADSDTTPGYYTIGGKDGDSLQIKVPDVETVSSTNIPAVSIIDTEAYKSDGVTLGRELINGQDFELSVTNASSAGTAAWNKDGAATEHATVASTSPAVTITGIGDYTGSITIPFNVGKNINNMGLTITYKVTGVETPYTYLAEYDNPSEEKARWHYTYNGETQKPTVVVKNGTQTLVRNKDYTLEFVNTSGSEDTCINAGWKNVVVTGINDYCGSMSQMYAIDRKAINATGGPYTTEDSMYATDDAGNNVLEFKVTGSAVKRFTADTATENLYETYLSDEADVQKFVGFYYATYDGNDVKPSVSVYDMTLGSNGNSTMQIDEELDLSIEYPSASTVTTFDLDSDGKLAGTGFEGVHCSDVVISFQNSATSATDFDSAGNYYVSSAGGNQFKIRYIILQDDVSDFVVEFENGFDSRQFDYNEGKTIPVADYISVKKGSRILDEGIDYEVTYKTKTYTNDDGTTFKLASNILPGEGTMVVTGIGKYRSSQEITFYINGNLADTGVYSKDSEGNYVLDIPTQQYTGKGITYGDPRLYLILPAQNAHSDNPYILRAGVDYEVDNSSYSSDSNYVADGKLTYVGKTTAYWSGSKEISYGVEFDADNVRATNYEPTYYFTGYPIEPAFGLSIPTATMGEITYSTTDLTNPGTVTATIPYTIGDKSGTVTATYEILAHPLSDTDNVKIDYTKTQRYTGRAVQPRFTVYITSTDLQTGEANDPYTLTLYDEDSNTSGLYDVDYGNYIYSEGGYSEDGTMGKGQFVVSAHDGVDVISGSRTCEYNIQLQSVVALSAEDTGDTITATWVKDLFSDGTDIVLQKLNSSGEYEDKVIQRIKGDTSEYTFTDLESSSKYRVVANAYAFTPSGELIKSADSSVELTTGIAKNKLAVDTSVAGRATITWPTTGNVKLYYIYRTEVDTGTEVLCAVIPRSTGTYTNTNAVSGKTYVYRIVGYALVNKVLEQVNESESDPVTIQ